MPFDRLQSARSASPWGTLDALAREDGSARHPHLLRLASDAAAIRDLADAAHHMCMLHGRHPGVLDHAQDHATSDAERAWLAAAAEAFAAERAFLVRLAAASGPLPSTPGQAESEAAVTHQRHAVDMLAQSDRTGCATGAAVGFVCDWLAIRNVLDAAARRIGLEPPASALPAENETASLVAAVASDLGIERALLFGAQQLFAQHRGLWDLLEARASARDRH